jgi:hypothetical protein
MLPYLKNDAIGRMKFTLRAGVSNLGADVAANMAFFQQPRRRNSNQSSSNFLDLPRGTDPHEDLDAFFAPALAFLENNDNNDGQSHNPFELPPRPAILFSHDEMELERLARLVYRQMIIPTTSDSSSPSPSHQQQQSQQHQLRIVACVPAKRTHHKHTNVFIDYVLQTHNRETNQVLFFLNKIRQTRKNNNPNNSSNQSQRMNLQVQFSWLRPMSQQQ